MSEMKANQSPIENAVVSVFIHVTDLRRSAEWYNMVLGLPLLEERLNGGNVYWFQLEGGTGIILDDNRNNAPDAPHVLFSYATTDIDASYRYLEEKGIQPLFPLEHPHPGLAYFIFADPDGNAIMVMQSDYISPVVQRLEDTKSPILNTISTIFINVTNMNRSIQFHNEVLGLQSREVRPGPENSIYSLSMNKGSEVLLDDNRFRNGEDYKILCMFAAKNIDDSKAYLELNGVQIFTDIERYGSVAFFTVEDPDGNVIMICSETN